LRQQVFGSGDSLYDGSAILGDYYLVLAIFGRRLFSGNYIWAATIYWRLYLGGDYFVASGRV